MTEKEKARAGLLYNNNFDPQLIRERTECQKKCQAYNALPVDAAEQRKAALRKILGSTGERFCIEQPFHCDYGYNITLGEDFYSNYNLVILDDAPITIGNHVFIAPDCGIYAAGVRILPGVTIGSNTVIGAGSVVVKDIPDGVLAAGNPCRVIRPLTPEELP